MKFEIGLKPEKFCKCLKEITWFIIWLKLSLVMNGLQKIIVTVRIFLLLQSLFCFWLLWQLELWKRAANFFYYGLCVFHDCDNWLLFSSSSHSLAVSHSFSRSDKFQRHYIITSTATTRILFQCIENILV